MKKIILAACVMFAFTGSAFAQPGGLNLRSQAALILDAEHGRILFYKNADAVLPIASITKLMTAIVVLDVSQPLTEEFDVLVADCDIFKSHCSRLRSVS